MMTRTFMLLPEEPMRPRIADPRINIFWQGRSEFSNEGNGMKPLYYANRWRLEPKDEAAYRRGELVEPKKQIVHPHPQPSSQPVLPITDIREVRRENEERLFYSCQSIADYEEYLRKYPKGRFVHKAKRAIQQIESEMMQSNPSTQEIHIRKNTRVNVRL